MSSVGPGSQQRMEFQNEKHSKKINADDHTVWVSGCQEYYETKVFWDLPWYIKQRSSRRTYWL